MYVVKSREERKAEIVQWLAIAHQPGAPGLTLRRIAKGLGMKSSNHLMGILWELVDENVLAAEPVEYRPNMTSWLFTVQPHKMPRLDQERVA